MKVEYFDEIEFEQRELIDELLKDIFKSRLQYYPILNEVTLRITNDTSFSPQALGGSINVIKCSLISFNCILTLSYTYWLIYRKYINGIPCNGQDMLFDREDIDIIKELMEYCQEHITYKTIYSISYPSNLPKTIKQFYASVDGIIALEFTRLIILYFLIHEIGHLDTTRHPPKFHSTIDEEIYCDKYAIDSMLLHCNEENFLKTAISIATALCILNINNIHKGKFESTDHPYGFDRLINNLEYYVAVDFSQDSLETKIWGYVVVILAFHTSNSKGKISNLPGEYSTFYSCVLAYREHFKKYQ